MKRTLSRFTAATALALATAASAQAACEVEYKAKRDNPLELFYDTTILSGPCNRSAVRPKLQSELAGKGLKLLKIISVREQ